MSSQVARLLFTSGLSLLAGGALGSYATRVIYGESVAPIDPAPPRARPCPVCRECPICPPPEDCVVAEGREPEGDSPEVVRTATAVAPVELLVPASEEPDRERLHGLPASAIQLATTTVRAAVAPCLEPAVRGEARGTILLDLTVTATGGQGFISEAAVYERSSDARETRGVEPCLVENARRARFEVSADDGEARFRLPVRLRRE